MLKKYFGTKDFYMKVLLIVVPMIIQNGITNFVGLLDNIMVGQVGTTQMSGVAIANQLMFVFNVCIFGTISGAGIFGAQFYGKGDHEGVRHTFRFKVIIGALVTGLFILVFIIGGQQLIMLYLHGDSAELTDALRYGREYLDVMLIGLIPYTIVQVYASTLRETGETVVPMKAGVAAVCVNLVLNYILIFGKFGCPAFGVVGAAIATNVSRFVELGIVVVWTHRHSERNIFIQGIYKTFRMPRHLARQILMKSMPLLINEALWSIGMATMYQCYSVRGLDVIAALNISSTLANLFNVVYLAMGNALAIIVGQLLGAEKMDEARDTDRKLLVFSILLCFVMGSLMICVSGIFPGMYNTTDQVKAYAASFIMVAGACMPMYGFEHACYFTLRSGGKTFITFVFDSLFVWVISIPCAFLLSRYSPFPIVIVYLLCQLAEIIKCVVGAAMVKSNMWMHNLTSVSNDCLP